jgi:poly(A) polymerase
MNINKLENNWLNQASAQCLSKAFKNYGHQALFVGGCVRNSILKVPVTDIDMATDALPETIIKISKENNFKFILTGLTHGTITIIIDKIAYQITTFRSDIANDGRYAKVEFTTSLLLDASRRDLTINALYCDSYGKVIDPLNVLEDLNNRIIKFIGDPNKRIAEDYLRILRFFRFQAIYGNEMLEIDVPALAACREHKSKLATLSKERITSELRKLFLSNNPTRTIIKMIDTGILNQLFDNCSINSFISYIEAEKKYKIEINWIGRLLSLQGSNIEEVLTLTRRELKMIKYTKKAIEQNVPIFEFSYYNGMEYGIMYLLLQHGMKKTTLNKILINKVSSIVTRKFPVTAKDLMPKLKGKKLGDELKKLESQWIESDFTLNKNQLLS